MIIMNMGSYDEILYYEGVYELGCLVWCLDFDIAMRFYSLHCTSIAWVGYMLECYYGGLSCDTNTICMLGLLDKNHVFN